MEDLKNISVKAEDVKTVLKEEGVKADAVKALAGAELTDEDLKELVGGLDATAIKNLAVKGLKYGAYALAGVAALATAEMAVRGKDSYAGKTTDWLRGVETKLPETPKPGDPPQAGRPLQAQ